MCHTLKEIQVLFPKCYCLQISSLEGVNFMHTTTLYGRILFKGLLSYADHMHAFLMAIYLYVQTFQCVQKSVFPPVIYCPWIIQSFHFFFCRDQKYRSDHLHLKFLLQILLDTNSTVSTLCGLNLERHFKQIQLMACYAWNQNFCFT